jgi:hypothetical protein
MDIENLAKELILKNMTPEQQMAVLDSVRQSVANAKEVQKKKIGENVDLVVQALKKIEADIRDRFDAVGNSIEKRVLSIQDGRDGANGKDGRDGKDGKSGRDGLKGDRGVDGQAGRDGVDGVDGISVVNAQIDFDGSLVITLSDGRELNVGEVVSQDIAEKIKVISTMSTNGAVGIKDEGTSISTGVKTINFVGAAVTATNSGDDVTVNVSSGTGTVTSVAATGGTGISVSGSPITTTGTLTITNTAPDQTVVLTAGTGISTSGTYPSFTVTNSAPDQTVALTQAGTTTITGTYPNFTISSADQFQGTVTSVAATVPAFLSVTGSPVTSTGTLAIGLSGTALPVANGGTGITAFGTGVATALGVNTGSSGAFVVNGGALGTPSSGTVTNLTGTASININGTVGATTANTGAFTTLSATGVTTVQAGTAALPAITTTGDTNTGIFFPAADTIAFTKGGAEAMRIDSDGDVGIATSSPAYKLDVGTGSVVGNIHTRGSISSGTLTGFLIRDIPRLTNDTATFENTFIGCGATAGNIIFQQGSSLTSASNTERARIDSSGNLLVGTASTGSEIGRLTVKQAFDADGGGLRLIAPNSSNAWAVRTGTDNNLYFGYNGTSKANINNSSGAYSALSDARLKENVQESIKGLSEILALRSVSYTFIDDEAKTEQLGFIAQEVELVIPEVVSTPNSSNQHYGLNYAGVVPVLVKAIQEQQALITALTARITALEAT